MEIVPTVVFPPVIPLTCQVTCVLVVLMTVAVNARVLPVWTLAVGGVTDTLTGRGGAVMLTCAEPERVGSATDTAVTATVDGEGTVAGAV